jgi:nucleotide-binding universal stress UspA family protein
MKNTKHWLVCLDLSKMDDVLIGYTKFLAERIEPKTITFLHIVDSGPTSREIIDQFPEISSKEEFDEIIRGELNDRIYAHFDDSKAEIRLLVKEGRPTNKIIEIDKSIEPDILIMGKKIGYVGEGVIPKRILKYIPTSILFVPENARYQLSNVLVPVDFSEQSANGVKKALDLVSENDGNVYAQHIFEYRAQFFPYMLSDEEKNKINKEVEKKKAEFISSYNLPANVEFILSKLNEGREADYVYEETINKQADLIVIGSKSKKLSALLRHDFTEKMANYAFGVPLLILKNKEKYSAILKSIFG